jgi:hypothetical protein
MHVGTEVVWAVTPYVPISDTSVSEKHAAYVSSVEDSNLKTNITLLCTLSIQLLIYLS